MGDAKERPEAFRWYCPDNGGGSALAVSVSDWSDDYIALSSNGCDALMDPERARDVARALNAAADAMEHIHGEHDDD